MFVWGLVCGLHGYNLTVRDQQNETDSILVYLNVEQDYDGSCVYALLPVLLALFRKVIPLACTSLALKRHKMVACVVCCGLELTQILWVINTIKIINNFLLNKTLFTGKPSVMVTPSNIVKAIHIVNILGEENSMIGEFHISDIQTLYCKLDCSGHGICSDATKECMCARFWMSNLIIFLINGMKHEDCAWSSIYFWIIVAVFSTIGASCFLFRRRSGIWSRVGRRKFKRRRRFLKHFFGFAYSLFTLSRYSVLHSDSEDDKKSQRIRNGHVILNRGQEDIFVGPRLAPLPIPHSSDSIDSESDDLLHKDRWEIQMKERTSTMNNHE
uniref:GP46-like surface antigen n=1 Tax=Heterorhabditis bacteriophora TaxID=37862 RepID=A0A1I7XGM9_HETBA